MLQFNQFVYTVSVFAIYAIRLSMFMVLLKISKQFLFVVEQSSQQNSYHLHQISCAYSQETSGLGLLTEFPHTYRSFAGWRLFSVADLESPMLLLVIPQPCSASKPQGHIGSPGWTLNRIILWFVIGTLWGGIGTVYISLRKEILTIPSYFLFP